MICKECFMKDKRKYYPILKKSALFSNISDESIDEILGCLESYIDVFPSGSSVMNFGDRITYAGIVLSGKLSILVFENDGTEIHLGNVIESEFFGCANSCMADQRSLESIVAKRETKILFLKLSNLFSPCAIGCVHASKMTANLLRQLSKESLFKNKRIRVMSQKRIRDKLIVYIEEFMDDYDKLLKVSNIQELANFLGVDRSALSREISNMKKMGIIEQNKNYFSLLNK